MVKSRTILMVYCFAIHTIFQVAGFPTVFEFPITIDEVDAILSSLPGSLHPFLTSEGT